VGNGDDFLDYIPTPVSVVGIDSASKISIGGIHSCVILKDRKLKCWGGNESGELTDGTIKTASVPVP
jgi:alpha-tubulin suppressor-like RCC1 family protein